jgi:hypothetical protein
MSQMDYELGSVTANTHTMQGLGKFSLLRIRGEAGGNHILLSADETGQSRIEMVNGTAGAKIDINVADCFDKLIKMRQFEVCVGGITEYVLLLGSATYKNPL